MNSCCSLSVESYNALLDWVKKEYKNMDDNFVSKDMFEKTLYGFAYKDKGGMRYIENAQRDYIYEKVSRLEQEGVFVAPIYAKTYWYNYNYRLKDVKNDFKLDLQKARNESYLEKIMKMCGRKDSFSKKEFLLTVEDVRNQWGDKPAETIKRYGYRWKIL